MSPYPLRVGGSRPRPTRGRKPKLREIVLGTGAFLIAVAACLYLVAALAP
jgi:type II secretory pathway component PulM